MHVIDTSTRSSPTDRRRLHYGNCTRGLGRSSRMLRPERGRFNNSFVCARRGPSLAMGQISAWPVAPRYIQMNHPTMTTEARRSEE
jgi:hypothetical protein